MTKKIYPDGDNIKFVDDVQTTPRTLNQIVFTVSNQTIAGVKTFSDTPKIDAIAERTSATGVTVDGVLIKDSLDTSGIVAKTGNQTVAGVKTLSDNLVFSGDKAIQTNIKARVYLGTIQENLVHNVWTKVLLDTESYDIGADFDTANNKFVVPVTGYYSIVGSILFQTDTVVVDKPYGIAIKQGETIICNGFFHSSHIYYFTGCISDIVYLSANDEITLYVKSLAAVDTVDIATSIAGTFLAIHLLSL